MMRESQDRYLINSIIRACAILKCFKKGNTSYKPGELAHLVELDRSTVYRILLSLEKCGMLERDEESGKYSLGAAVLRMGTVYLHSTDLLSTAHPLMSELAHRTKETVNLTVLSGTQVLYIDKVDSPQSLGMLSEVGSLMPVHCTGVGKVLLAHQPPKRIKEYLHGCELVGLTKNTITSKTRLLDELKKIRTNGYGEDNREFAEEVACYAAPVFDYQEKIIAALSIAGPYQRMAQPGVKEEMILEVRRTAAQISEKMGFPKN